MNHLHWKEKRGWIFLLLILVLVAVGMIVRPEASDVTSSGLRAVAALCVVLGLTFVGAHWVKKWAQRTGHLGVHSGVGIQILGIKGLGSGRSILLVEVDGERLLLGAGRDTIVCLAHLAGQNKAHENPSLTGEG
jgi:flagellar biogenesis protein FliO